MVLLLACAGCSGLVTPKGQVLKGDQPFQPRGGKLEVTFVPYVEGQDRVDATYPAEIGPDSTFVVLGPKRKGIPKGKYRILVQVIPPMSDSDRDRLKGAFGPDKSPFIFDVTSSDEIVLDIGNAAK